MFPQNTEKIKCREAITATATTSLIGLLWCARAWARNVQTRIAQQSGLYRRRSPETMRYVSPKACKVNQSLSTARKLECLQVIYLRWTTHPVIVTIRNNRDYIRVLLYSYSTTIAGWGVLLTYTLLAHTLL